jgi:hypothetical protein
MVVTESIVIDRPAVPARRPLWIFGAGPDLVMSLSWVPVFLVWHLVAAGSGVGADHRLQQGVVLALLISFLHQPLTFGLVYGDRRQFALHRRLFVWTPVLAVGVAVLAAERNWWIVVPVAAIWNLQHTVQQRYGVQRIYSGRSGYGSARLDRAISYVPMAAVLLTVAAIPATTSLVKRSGLDPRNAQGIELLVRLRPVAIGLLVVAVAATGVVVLAAVRQEARAGLQANPAKWLYQGASLVLLGSIVIDPVAGFIAYVTAHAVEYAVIVDRTARRRYASSLTDDSVRADPSFLGRVARSALGRTAFFGIIVVVALALHDSVHGVSLNALVYSVGVLHFTYDAVIWKLRKPNVARDFALARTIGP